MVTNTGLGNPDPPILNNMGALQLNFAEDAINTYFNDQHGCDFSVTDDCVMIGIEPAYQYEKLKIIAIDRDKGHSYIRTGYAFGGYGSQLVSKKKHYKDYTNNCKFIKFVDKWHRELFPIKENKNEN